MNVAIADGGAVHVFAADPNPPAFTSGSGFTVTANFADGTSATATVDPAARADDLERDA